MVSKAAFSICWTYTLNAQQYTMPPSIHLAFVMVEILRDKPEASIESLPSLESSHANMEHGKLPSIDTHVGAGSLLTQDYLIT